MWLVWRVSSLASVRRAVEHEAVVSLKAQSDGARTPRLISLAEVGPNSLLLAYEAVDGRPRRAISPACARFYRRGCRSSSASRRSGCCSPSDSRPVTRFRSLWVQSRRSRYQRGLALLKTAGIPDASNGCSSTTLHPA